MIYFCSDKNRRALVLATPALNGIDFLEVIGPSGCGKQLALTLLKDARGLTLTPNNIVITGGAAVQVVSVSAATNDDPFVLTVNLSGPGEFSPYALAVVAGSGISDPPDGFDPQLSTVSFSFKAGCPTPADCLPDNCCPAPVRSAPDINYLAKEYGAFRQVMLDRLAVLVRHVTSWWCTRTRCPDRSYRPNAGICAAYGRSHQPERRSKASSIACGAHRTERPTVCPPCSLGPFCSVVQRPTAFRGRVDLHGHAHPIGCFVGHVVTCAS
jgi:hypothetical protein